MRPGIARPSPSGPAPRLIASPQPRGAVWPLLGLAAITVIALAIRLPLFGDVPGYTDETQEVLRGLAIARGQLLPLTNMANYIGPGWNYLLALVFLIVGPQADAARAVMVVVGTACVPVTGWLAWRAGGPIAGLVAAGLMATSAMAVLLGSHVAWSVCLTPLLVGLTLALLRRAMERPSAGRLAAAALVYGLALHAHPVAGAAAPGLALALLLAPAGRRLLASWRRLLAAAFAFAIPQTLVLLDVLLGNRFLRQLEGPLHRTTFAPTLDPVEIGSRIPDLLVQVLRLVASTLEGSGDAGAYLRDPRFVLFALWLLGGLLLAAWRREWLLVLPPLSFALVWPIVAPNYDLFYESRYSLFLLPPLYATMGCAAAALSGAALEWARSWRLPATFVLAAIGAALLLWPLPGLASYMQRQVDTARSNQVARAALALADEQGGQDTLLLFDHGLIKPGVNSGGTYLDWLIYRRTMSGEPFRDLDLTDRAQLRPLLSREPRRILVLGRARSVSALRDAYDLREAGRFARDDAAFALYIGTRRGHRTVSDGSGYGQLAAP